MKKVNNSNGDNQHEVCGAGCACHRLVLWCKDEKEDKSLHRMVMVLMVVPLDKSRIAKATKLLLSQSFSCGRFGRVCTSVLVMMGHSVTEVKRKKCRIEGIGFTAVSGPPTWCERARQAVAYVWKHKFCSIKSADSCCSCASWLSWCTME